MAAQDILLHLGTGSNSSGARTGTAEKVRLLEKRLRGGADEVQEGFGQPISTSTASVSAQLRFDPQGQNVVLQEGVEVINLSTEDSDDSDAEEDAPASPLPAALLPAAKKQKTCAEGEQEEHAPQPPQEATLSGPPGAAAPPTGLATPAVVSFPSVMVTAAAAAAMPVMGPAPTLAATVGVAPAAPSSVEPSPELLASPALAATPPTPATAPTPRDDGGASEASPGSEATTRVPASAAPREEGGPTTPHEAGEGKAPVAGGLPKRASSSLREKDKDKDKEGHAHKEGHVHTPPGGTGQMKLAIRNSKISHYFMPAHAVDEDKDKAARVHGPHQSQPAQLPQRPQRDTGSPHAKRALLARSTSQKASDGDGSNSRSASDEGGADAHSAGSGPNRDNQQGTVSSKSSQGQSSKGRANPALEVERLKRWLATSEEACAALQRGKDQLQGDLATLGKNMEQLTRDKEALSEELKHTCEMEKMKDGRISKLSHAVAEYAVAVAKLERSSCRERVRQDCLRLGNIGVIMVGTSLSEVWEEGHAVLELQEKMIDLVKQRERVERRRKENKKLLAALPEVSTATASGDQSSQPSLQEALASEEAYKAKLANIKREEESLVREKERMDVLKLRHLRELKRIKEEDGSRFNKFGILHKRYVLLNLLGKGGFSEVYKAYDVVDLCERACKIHQLNSTWSEAKKQSYLRHAMREYQIHKAVAHPNVVQLFDIFQIDENTFATVLEYCEGMDLDAHLKANPTLPEKEARAILVQIFAGLAYLNHPSHLHRVIHYDLKPGNILFDAVGEVKITDFGLSKVIEEQGVDCMELTSQGAGTYWYLPPECFEMGKGPPKISSKVDVWSAGVIFFQMLFGRRPFGHELSQENILRENVIRRANKVDFPAKPAVSAEAKEFIQLCLTHNQADRPDVLTIVQHPYLSLGQKPSGGGRRSSTTLAPPS